MIFYAVLCVPIVAFLGAFVWLISVRSRLALAMTISMSSFVLAIVCAVTWFLRDGMGPDSIPSEGMEAVQRFFADAIFPIAAWVVFVVVSVIIYCSK